jgi:hypothetical protein
MYLLMAAVGTEAIFSPAAPHQVKMGSVEVESKK